MRRVVLEESSGPVAPRFQYSLTVEASDDGQLRVAWQRPQSAGGNVDETRQIAPARVTELLAELGDVHELGDLVPAEKRVGVSYNRLSIEDGTQPPYGFTYLLNALKDPQNARQRAAVEAVKRLAGPSDDSSEAGSDPR